MEAERKTDKGDQYVQLTADEIAIAHVDISILEMLGVEDQHPPRSVTRISIHWRHKDYVDPRADLAQYFVLKITLSADRDRPIDIDSGGHPPEQVSEVFRALALLGMEPAYE